MSSFSQPKHKANQPSSSSIQQELTSETSREQNTQASICNLIDLINDNNLSLFYEENESNFKHNIDQLNLKFYLETEKILSPSSNSKQSDPNKLFLILFKQIHLYIKEIERLNSIILNQSQEPSSFKKRTALINQHKDTFEFKEHIIQTLKNSISGLEKKLSQSISNENTLREENEKLKQQLKQIKESETNTNSSNNTSLATNFINSQYQRKSKRTYSDLNPSMLSMSSNGGYSKTNFKKKNSKILLKSTNNSKINNNINNNSNYQNQSNFNSKFIKHSHHASASNKLKIIKAVKNKMSHSNSKTINKNGTNHLYPTHTIDSQNNTINKINGNINIINCNNNGLTSGVVDENSSQHKTSCSPGINSYNKRLYKHHDNRNSFSIFNYKNNGELCPFNLCSLSFSRDNDEITDKDGNYYKDCEGLDDSYNDLIYIEDLLIDVKDFILGVESSSKKETDVPEGSELQRKSLKKAITLEIENLDASNGDSNLTPQFTLGKCVSID